MHTPTPKSFADVEVSIDDDFDPFARVTGEGGNLFRKTFVANLYTVSDVLGYWADCCAVGGFLDVSELDGWADMPKGSVTLALLGVGAEPVEPPASLV